MNAKIKSSKATRKWNVSSKKQEICSVDMKRSLIALSKNMRLSKKKESGTRKRNEKQISNAFTTLRTRRKRH